MSRSLGQPLSAEDCMLKRSFFTVGLVLALAPVALSGQVSARPPVGGRPSLDNVTVGGSFGGLSGAANLNDPGTADWRVGWAASVDATAWLTNNLGVREIGRAS